MILTKEWFRRHYTKRRVILGVGGSLLCSLGCTRMDRAEIGSEWAVYRGQNRDGISSETGWSSAWPKQGPREAWRKSIGIGVSAVTVSKGCAYTMGYKDGADTVYCLNSNTGATIWSRSYPSAIYNKDHEGGPASTPTLHKGKVYTLSREGDLYCFDALNGEIVWSKDLQDEDLGDVPYWGFSGSPLVDEDQLNTLIDTNSGTIR